VAQNEKQEEAVTKRKKEKSRQAMYIQRNIERLRVTTDAVEKQ
jgi:hypothetical protein